ncbi:DNA-binding transcriptional regulator, ArsR family [Devosia crocina]|uniref:DNA-binding transcriptional regulator, ArsR family n=1 Tax=Devosia crocina TaxID=429728 RepID=A0A1I7NJ76_9HYPH|nr:metalloregulator ArsR/SmtB family transcription factor [Devosia crocina]SFV34717.1 DNA-binding transcriptional regulator, ArsR family [Devosia crocina]
MTKKPKPPISLYSALADATRYRILEILRDGPKPVHVLTEGFSISRPAISRHLRVLKTAGLVAEVKKGRENLYAFKPAKLEAARSFIDLLALREPQAVKAKPVPKTVGEPASDKLVIKKAKATPSREPAPPQPAPVPAANQMGFDF